VISGDPIFKLAHCNIHSFHRYILNLILIIGAYGEVRKCLNKNSKALRAVKIINKVNLADHEREKLLNEIDILKQLDHPNILKLFEFFQD